MSGQTTGFVGGVAEAPTLYAHTLLTLALEDGHQTWLCRAKVWGKAALHHGCIAGSPFFMAVLPHTFFDPSFNRYIQEPTPSYEYIFTALQAHCRKKCSTTSEVGPVFTLLQLLRLIGELEADSAVAARGGWWTCWRNVLVWCQEHSRNSLAPA